MEDEKIIIHAKLPDLDAVQNDFTRRVGERICSVAMYMYPTVWGSSTKGNSGIGLCMMTPSYTVIVYDSKNDIVGVYWDEVFGYTLCNPNKKFWDDLHQFSLNPSHMSSQYLSDR